VVEISNACGRQVAQDRSRVERPVLNEPTNLFLPGTAHWKTGFLQAVLKILLVQIGDDSVTKLELPRPHENVRNWVLGGQESLDEVCLAAAPRNSIHFAEETKVGRAHLS